jgi:hypothetical protein
MVRQKAAACPSAKKSAMEPPTVWWQRAIADNVIVWVRDGAGPWRTKQLRAVVEEFPAA